MAKTQKNTKLERLFNLQIIAHNKGFLSIFCIAPGPLYSNFPKGRKHCGKRRNCSLRAISPFPIVFSNDLYSRQVKTRVCLGKG